MAFLRLEAERGGRPGFKALDADRLARILAIAVDAVVDPAQGGTDGAAMFTALMGGLTLA